MILPEAPSLPAIRAARERLAGTIFRTPLIALDLESGPARVFLKLESLQPTGSFKVRGAGNALLAVPGEDLRAGVWTASAGNMGQALAWYARRLGVACTVVMPEDAPRVKLEAVRRLGARTVLLPFEQYQALQRHGQGDEMQGRLVHPFADEAVMAGNGTLGPEILEDLPEVTKVLVPFGGGGLSCGIAAWIKTVRPDVRVEAIEVATAAPLTASFAGDTPVAVDYHPSFVSGIGAPSVFPQMWPLARRWLDGARSVSLAEVAEATRLMAGHAHIVAEGAGAVALAAALQEPAARNVVCLVSGGNIGLEQLAIILRGELP